VAFAAAVTHIAFIAIVPVVPLFLVNRLGATEGFMALFGMVELAAGASVAMFTTRLVNRIGNRALISIGMAGTGLAAAAIALSPNLTMTLIGAALSGASWTTVASVGLFGYLMESTPSEDMTAVSSAYHQVIGLAAFVAPLIGSTLAQQGVSLVVVLMIGALLRVIASPLIESSLITRWRHPHKQIAHQAL
jgi:MFS family permease